MAYLFSVLKSEHSEGIENDAYITFYSWGLDRLFHYARNKFYLRSSFSGIHIFDNIRIKGVGTNIADCF